MSRYAKGTMGKLIIQDWDVVSSYDSDPLLYILTPQQAAALIALAESLYWRKRWINPPDSDTLDTFTAEAIFNLMNPITCAMLNACLEPQFEGLQTLLEAVQETAEAALQAAVDNAASERFLTQSTVENELCGAAGFVVSAMFQTFVDTYNETEAAPLDNLGEFIVAFLRAIPIISELPFDDMILIINWYFENQFLEFQNDYEDLKEQLICDLKCFVQANGNSFTWDVWALWLDYTGATYPDNRAAQGFARYSPYRQTWVNQIAALINRDASLQSYFDTLSAAWESGLLNPAVCDCECSIDWCHTFDFLTSEQGWEATPDGGAVWVADLGWAASSPLGVRLQRAWTGAVQITSVTFLTVDDIPVTHQLDTTYPVGSPCFIQGGGNGTHLFTVDTSGNFCYVGLEYLLAGVTKDGLETYTGAIQSIEICGYGIEPEWD